MKTTKVTCDICKGTCLQINHIIGPIGSAKQDVYSAVLVENKKGDVEGIDVCGKCAERVSEKGLSRLIEEDRAYA